MNTPRKLLSALALVGTMTATGCGGETTEVTTTTGTTATTSGSGTANKAGRCVTPDSFCFEYSNITQTDYDTVKSLCSSATSGTWADTEKCPAADNVGGCTYAGALPVYTQYYYKPTFTSDNVKVNCVTPNMFVAGSSS